MTFIQAIILSIVQGIGEFLPISSSGHLALTRHFLQADIPPSIDVVLHLATVLSIIIVLRQDILVTLKKPFLYGSKIFVTILPAGIVGLLVVHWREQILDLTWLIALMLIFWGIIFIWLVKFYSLVYKDLSHSVDPTKGLEKLTYKQAFIIGLAQVLALIPGTSRSGITTLAGVLVGLNLRWAARYSFLAGVPLIAMAGLMGSLDLFTTTNGFTNNNIFVAMIMTSILGVFAIKLFVGKHVKTVLLYSGIYRIILGIGLLIIL